MLIPANCSFDRSYSRVGVQSRGPPQANAPAGLHGHGLPAGTASNLRPFVARCITNTGWRRWPLNARRSLCGRQKSQAFLFA